MLVRRRRDLSRAFNRSSSNGSHRRVGVIKSHQSGRVLHRVGVLDRRLQMITPRSSSMISDFSEAVQQRPVVSLDHPKDLWEYGRVNNTCSFPVASQHSLTRAD